ncbi:hypothetical protein SAMN04515675_4122 [Pseudomonas costantinii]|uniref:Uncharacterized protein n=1 Tax=Pseudomonas costantinii TaxID=168469 RepID=A0A1H5GFB3_9PSED|nr:hypothetical protein SAMN04515675_4122 [Pseudomonas costantinii]
MVKLQQRFGPAAFWDAVRESQASFFKTSPIKKTRDL